MEASSTETRWQGSGAVLALDERCHDEPSFFIVSDMWALLLCATDICADLLTVSNGVRIISYPFHEPNKK
jgi:hypothetical protein